MKRIINFFEFIFLLALGYQNALICMQHNESNNPHKKNSLALLKEEFNAASPKERWKIVINAVKEKNKQDEGTLVIKDGSNEIFSNIR
jgi:hypothetical protein